MIIIGIKEKASFVFDKGHIVLVHDGVKKHILFSSNLYNFFEKVEKMDIRLTSFGIALHSTVKRGIA